MKVQFKGPPSSLISPQHANQSYSSQVAVKRYHAAGLPWRDIFWPTVPSVPHRYLIKRKGEGAATTDWNGSPRNEDVGAAKTTSGFSAISSAA